MNKTCKLSLLLAIALGLSSCGSKLALTREHFTLTPETLEVVGGKVEVSYTGVIPEKSFPSKSLVTITPVLKYEGGEVEGTPITLQGEKAVGNNQVIPTKAGGNFSGKVSFDYIPEMQRSELYARIVEEKGGRVPASQRRQGKGNKVVNYPEVKLADGVVSTENLANAKTATPAPSVDAFQRIIQENTEATILFLIQQAEVRNNQLKSEEMKALNNALADAVKAENKEVSGVKISSYASPDGGVELNEKLAGQREKNTTKYINKAMKKAKAQGAVEGEFTAQDWEGFKALVEASNIQDKELILRVLSMYSDPEQREAEIKNLAAAYKVLADEVLPQLRRSKINLTVDVIGRSDDEIKAAYEAGAAELSLEEMLYAATLYNTAAEKEAVYNKTIEMYPDDYRAYNNIGNIKYAAGDLEAAKSWYEKAYAKEASKEVALNLALIALSEGADNATIEAYLNKATGAENYEEALGLFYIKKGQYAEAVKTFGDKKCNNAALAQILVKDYTKAKATLAAVDADADTYYLQALIGAKTNNKAEVVAGLKSAIAADANVKAKVAKDIEFAKYATDEEVAALLK